MQIGNILDVEITAALTVPDRVEVHSATCEHLPWLDSDRICWEIIRPAVEAELNSKLSEFVHSGGDHASIPLLQGTAAVLNRALQKFSIAAEVRPRLRLEEHAPGLGGEIARKLSESALEQIDSRMAAERITWIPFDGVLEGNARVLNVLDIKVSPEVVPVVLGEPSVLMLAAPRGVRLCGIAIVVNGREIASANCSLIIQSGDTAVKLPDIPVTAYREIREHQGSVEFVLRIGNEERRVGVLNVRLGLP